MQTSMMSAKNTASNGAPLSAEPAKADPAFTMVRFVQPDDIPMTEAQALLREHGALMYSRMINAGGPHFEVEDHIKAFWTKIGDFMPPNGSYYLAYNRDGRVVGTASMRRISDTTGEMKHLYVSPDMRRTGLGRALVNARIDDAREMGLKTLIADTFAANHELPALYESVGFEQVPQSSENATASLSPQLAKHILYFRLAL